jgi:hypothetical protein
MEGSTKQVFSAFGEAAPAVAQRAGTERALESRGAALSRF